jgi:hypothetical protein
MPSFEPLTARIGDQVKRPRVKIITLMTVVGVVALNLAVGRALYAYDIEILGGSVLIGLSLQMGLIGLIRRRGRARAFWAGFVVAGSLAFLTFLLAERPGAYETVWYRVWSEYIDIAQECLMYWPGGAAIRAMTQHQNSAKAAIFVVSMLMFAVPQLLIALSGGLLAVAVFWIASRRLDRSQ